MNKLFELIEQSELLGLGFLVTAAMVMGVSLIFFFLLLILLDKKSYGVIRPIKDPQIIIRHLEKISTYSPIYKGNILNIDQGRDPKSGSQNLPLALVVLKNYGLNPAIDIQVLSFGKYKVKDNYSKRLFSLSPGEACEVLINIPKDMLSSIVVSEMKVRYKNEKNRFKTDKFSLICEPEYTMDIKEDYHIQTFVQI